MGSSVTDVILHSCDELHSELHFFPDGNHATEPKYRMTQGVEP